MKNGINNKYSVWLLVIITSLCWTVTASEPTQANESSEQWQIEHLTNGKTRLEFVHGNKTHFYEIFLTGVEIDGESRVLSNPKITVQKNQVIKHWLPFLKETWTDSQGYTKWSFELNRPEGLADSAKQILLKFDSNSDGRGGIIVGDSTTLEFDQGSYDVPLDKPRGHEYKSIGAVNLPIFSSRCHNATGIYGLPGKNKIISFDLQNDSFPIFTQSSLMAGMSHEKEKQTLNSNWFLAKFSEHNDGFQLVAPSAKRVNGQMTSVIHIVHKSRANDVISTTPESISLQSMVVMKPEKDLIDYVNVSGIWYPLIIDKTTRKSWASKPNVDHLNRIKAALLELDNLAEDYFFGKNIIIEKNDLYAISNDNEVSQINRFKNKQHQWTKQEPIKIQNQSVTTNGIEVFREIMDVMVKDNLMVVAMTPSGMRVPLNTEDSQSVGEVRVYRKIRDNWQLEEILVSELGNSDDGFGEVIAVDNGMVVVSAPNFGPDDPDKVRGMAHVFTYKSGQWQNPVVINPPIYAKNDGYFKNRGFGSELQLVGDDLYIKAIDQGYSSTNLKQMKEPVDCPYFDSFGVIYHYRKKGNQWLLIDEIKSNENASNLIGPMFADSSGLYFLSRDFDQTNSSSDHFMSHYKNGQIQWKHLISKLH